MKLIKTGANDQSPQPLTTEKLRTYKGLENLSDDQAAEIIASFDHMAVFLYEFVLEQKAINNNPAKDEPSDHA